MITDVKELLCKAMLAYWLNMSMGKFTACVFGNALQYTTAHLQVLFSLQHLGRITKD